MQPPPVAVRLVVFLLLLAGCAEAPVLMQLGEWNPYLRRKWAEDEEYGPTFYTRMDELKDVRRGAERLSPAEQEQLAMQLADIVRYDENPMFRREAVRTLAVLKQTPASGAPLREAVSDPSVEVREAACFAWGERGGPEAVAILGGIVRSDQDLDVRIAATEQLGRFAEPAAIESLEVALNDNDPAIQYRAMQSLKTTTDQDFGNNVTFWREYLQGGNPRPGGPSIVERLTNWF